MSKTNGDRDPQQTVQRMSNRMCAIDLCVSPPATTAIKKHINNQNCMNFRWKMGLKTIVIVGVDLHTTS